MKREIMIMAGFAAMAISCTKTEFLEVSDSMEIRFENAFVDKLTKADITNSSLNSFVAYGHDGKGNMLIENLKVSRNKTDGTWEYGSPVLWQKSEGFTFSAYAPSDAYEAISGISSDEKFTFDYNSDNFHQHDLVLAEERYVPGQSVELDFKHMLSILSFVIKSEESSGVIFRINSMKVSGINTTGHFNGSEFVGLADPGTYDLTEGTGGTCCHIDDFSSREIYVLPQELSKGECTIELDIDAVDTFGNLLTYNDNLVIKLPSVQWKESNSYTISTDLNVNEINPDIKVHKIEFSVGVSDWEPADGCEIRS